MKRIIIVPLASLASFWLVLHGLAGPASDLTLGYKFKPSQVDSYHVTFDMSETFPKWDKTSTNGRLPPEQWNGFTLKATMAGDMTTNVTKVNSDGSAQLEARIRDVRYSDNQGASHVSRPGDFLRRITVKKDGGNDAVNGFVVRPPTSMSSGDVQQLLSIGVFGGQLPERGIRVGDSWFQSSPLLTPHKSIQQKVLRVDIKCTLVADNILLRGTRVCKIAQQYSANLDISREMNARPNTKSTLTVSGSGTVLFDRAAGKLISQEAAPHIVWGGVLPNGKSVSNTVVWKWKIQRT